MDKPVKAPTRPPDFGKSLAGLDPGHGDILSLRNEASRRVRLHLDAVRAAAESALSRNGHGTACAEYLASAQDNIIASLFSFAAEACKSQTEAGRLAVIAVGGYGRGTLAPGSDIDLLFLVPDAPSAAINSVIEFLLYTLWDARQKVGHATRTIADSLSYAKSDNTIMTAILEARLITGNEALFAELTRRYRSSILQKGVKAFVAGKLAERDQRHAKQGISRYAVEPDLKEGKGGLRDLNTMFWIAKAIFDAGSPDELAEKGVFSRAELRRFQKCEDHLWAVRCHLHFLAKRGEDKLSFDRQSDLAERLGYKAHGGLKHVERFMRHYFLLAREVGNLTRIFCASLEAKHLKDAPSMGRMFNRLLPKKLALSRLPKGFAMDMGRLTLAGGDVLKADPANVLRLFAVASEKGIEIHPDALKHVSVSLRLIDDQLRDDPDANHMFIAMLCDAGDPESLLRAMNEAGVLGRFLPEFGKVVAMMQFNMYHHYTVDEHLVRTVGVLKSLENGDLADDHPLSAKLFPTVTSRRALYVAGLLHDIAKGRPEDHSIAGERVARKLCPRLGLSEAETETVAWLIRHHLLMSETSQMRDLNDFKTIMDFAAIVQSPERLKLLLILTVADIRAVGPGVWNGWKGQLLRTLYAEAEPLLTGGHTAGTRSERVAEAQASFLQRLPALNEKKKARILARHYDAYWLNVPLEQQLRHESLIADASPRDVTTDIKTDAFAGVTELTVYVPDHPRLLATLTGACAAANANIIGAQIFTTNEGMALDTIMLQREFADEGDELRRATRVTDTIRKALKGQLRLREAMAQARKPEFRVGAFSVPPRVIIDNASSNKHTVVEINGLDRVGLLHDLTDALYQLNLNIASAHVTTFGEKVIDVFYVTDLTGAKIESESRSKRIEQALLEVLEKP
jgi:[protein-PII] uridylyltransferase